MNLQTYLALKAVVEADFEKLIFYQAVSDIDPPNYAIKSVGPAALISLADAAAVPAESIKIDFEPIQEDDPEPPHSYSGSLVQFASKKQVNAEDVLVSIEPVQAGSGDPSPDNVRPISGWTGAKVTRTGKNLLYYYDAFSGAYNLTGSVIPNSGGGIRLTGTPSWATGARSFNIMRFIPADLVTINGIKAIAFCDSPYCQIVSTAIDKNNRRISITANVVASTSQVTIDIYVVLYVGDAPTTFAPYQGDTYDITFPSEAGTVYGGTLDVVNGVLTVDRAMVDLGTLTWNASSSASDAFYCNNNAPPYALQNVNMMCSLYKYGGAVISDFYNDMTIKCWKRTHLAAPHELYIKDSRYTDVTSFTSGLSGVQLCYELATTVIYTLTPQQIALLRGGNTLWADTGDVKVDTPLIPAPISGRTGLKLYHSGSTQNMPDLVEVDGKMNLVLSMEERLIL